MEQLIVQWESCPDSEPVSWNLAHSLHLVGVAVAWRSGSRLLDVDRILRSLEKILSPSNALLLPHSVFSVSLHLVTSLLLVGSTLSACCHAHLSRLLRLLCVRGEGGGGVEEVRETLNCFRELVDQHPQFLSVSFPKSLILSFSMKKSTYIHVCIYFLAYR